MTEELQRIDMSFGRLWPYFDLLCRKVTADKYIPSKFVFEAGKTPLSTFPEAFIGIAAYYLVIFGGSYVIKMANIKPMRLDLIFKFHNVMLTIVSLTLLVLMLEQIIPIGYRQGLLFAICNKNAWTQPLQCLYYLNYLVKFVEFGDTLFLVLRHKPLTLLHTYHHGATALLCYTQLVGETPISWVPIVLNLFVHVIMYWYYFLTSSGIKVWWKEWVTRVQIIQFVLDLIFIYFAFYQKVSNAYFPAYCPYPGNDCHCTWTAAFSGCFILSSYLVLFIAFYLEVYRKASKRTLKVRSIEGGYAAKVNEYVNETRAQDFDDVLKPKLPNPKRSHAGTI